MKTILISGASGIVGYGVLRSLKDQPYRTIGTSIYNDTAANCFSDIFELAPKTDDLEYLPWLINIIKKYNVDMIIPGIEADMFAWNDSRANLAKLTYPLLNSQFLIDTCKDKWLFYQQLVKHNSLCRIDSSLENDFNYLTERFGLPFLIKPRRGFASKGIVKITDELAFSYYKNSIGKSLMVQPLVGDDDHEFTISAFFDSESNLCCCQQLQRKLNKSGYTEVANTISLPKIESLLKELASIFKPIGPTNFQFREHKGSLKLLEINPRISSSTSIRKAFGYNETLMSIDYFLNGRKPNQPILKNGKAIRYTEDFIFTE